MLAIKNMLYFTVQNLGGSAQLFKLGAHVCVSLAPYCYRCRHNSISTSFLLYLQTGQYTSTSTATLKGPTKSCQHDGYLKIHTILLNMHCSGSFIYLFLHMQLLHHSTICTRSSKTNSYHPYYHPTHLN